MLSLMYVSMAQPGITAEELDALVVQAAEHNTQLEITGLLAYNSLSFMQLLEGEGTAVLDVMRHIERDPRHSGITYIRQDTREKRECPDWSMRSLITPMTGIGSAKVFTGSLPRHMELDTKILFTSFASSLTADEAARHAENEQQMLQESSEAQND